MSDRTERRRWPRLIRRIVLGLVVVPFVGVVLFRFVAPPFTPLMLIRRLQGHEPHQEWVAWSAIAPALAEAVIASEDNQFCREPFGFDIAALRGQIDAWEDGDRPRGASTITMQTAKNLFLWPGRDPFRKAIEAWLTPQVALIWPKRRVLEVYLNIVEFGPGIYGAEEAARTFFHKPAAALTVHEAAQLASVLPRPLVWSAQPPGPYVRQRAGVIERRIEQIRPLLSCAE